jgi:hypothetical protein
MERPFWSAETPQRKKLRAGHIKWQRGNANTSRADVGIHMIWAVSETIDGA